MASMASAALHCQPAPSRRAGVAADAIRDILRSARQPVTLVGIAPATNLALALMTEPALADGSSVSC